MGMESKVADLPADDEVLGQCRRYSIRELAEIAHTSPRRFRSWIQAGLIQPSPSESTGDAFSFHQVRTAGLLAKLARNGIGTARLKRILDQLRRRFPDAQEALSQLDLFAGLLVIRDDDSRLTAPNGQLLLDLLSDGDSTQTVTLKLGAADPADCADDLFQSAVSLEQAGELQAAAQAYRECLLQTGPEVAACFNLANVLAELGHAEAAAERYRQVVELDPQYAAAWNNLGLALAELNDGDGALDAWERAVELDAASADAVFNLADALQEANRFDDARPNWEAYLRLDSDSEWSSYARFCLDAAASDDHRDSPLARRAGTDSGDL
jgi:tetratricopeptide (TPR) repeat protein